jgi:hypothetical protein
LASRGTGFWQARFGTSAESTRCLALNSSYPVHLHCGEGRSSLFVASCLLRERVFWGRPRNSGEAVGSCVCALLVAPSLLFSKVSSWLGVILGAGLGFSLVVPREVMEIVCSGRGRWVLLQFSSPPMRRRERPGNQNKDKNLSGEALSAGRQPPEGQDAGTGQTEEDTGTRLDTRKRNLPRTLSLRRFCGDGKCHCHCCGRER